MLAASAALLAPAADPAAAAAAPCVAMTEVPPTGPSMFGVTVLTSCRAWATTGTATIDQWDGANWTAQDAPVVPGSTNNFLSAVTAVSATDAWAAGNYNPDSVSPAQVLIEHWNGSAWSLSPSPTLTNAGISGLDASSGTDAWAVGAQRSSQGQALTEHWDGKSWTVVPAPSPGTSARPQAVADISPTNAWLVGGNGVQAATSTTGPAFIEHWDGTSWTVTPTRSFPPFSNLTAVSALSATDIWAVGSVSDPTASTQSPLIVHYDGTSWTVTPNIPSPRRYSTLAGVAVTSTGAMAAGRTSDVSAGSNHPLVLRWDGTAWTQLPTASPGTNSALMGVGGTSNNYWAVGWSTTDDTDPLAPRNPLPLHCC